MAEPTTYIKLDRNLLRWRWYKDSNTTRVFIHLLLTANYGDLDFENITVERGQIVTSYKSIGSFLGLSYQSVRTAIAHLKSTGEITVKTYPKYSVITIVNYGLYQDKLTGTAAVNQQSTNSQLTVNQQQEKKERKKEINNNNNSVAKSKFLPPTLDEVKAYCSERNNHVDAERFVDYYSANGWVQGKGKPIKDWKACVRTWERGNNIPARGKVPAQSISEKWEAAERRAIPPKEIRELYERSKNQ